MNDAPNDPDVNRMMAVFDKLLRQTNVAKDEMAMSVNSFVGRAQDIIAAKIAENTELRAQLAERDALIAEVTKTLGGYPDSDLLSLARTVAIGYQQWSDGHDAMTDNLRAQLAERGMELVIKEMRIDSLTAALDDVRNRWHDAEQDWMQLRAQLAKCDAEIADDHLENQYLFQIAELRGRVAKHKATIAERDATIATLTERLARCTCTDDDGNEAP